MESKLLMFTLNVHENLTILLENQNDIIDCCYESPMVLNINNNSTVIGNKAVFDYVERLHNKLELALLNKLQLDSSIKQNIGYYWNQFLNEESSNLFFLEDKEGRYWTGLNYFLWGTAGGAEKKFGVWLYNDALGNIIFEVTPLFSGTLVDGDDPEEVKLYEKWMKLSYKPFFTQIISHDLAKQWLEQTNLILKIIENNVQKLEEQDNAD